MKTFKQLRAEQAGHSDAAEDKELIGKEIKAKVKPEALKSGGKGEKPVAKPEAEEGDEGEEKFGESVEGKDGTKNLAKEFAKSSMGRAQKMQKDKAKDASKEHKKDCAYEDVQQVAEDDSIEGLARKAARAHAMRISAKIDADKKRRKEEQDKYEKTQSKTTAKNEETQVDEKSPFSIPEPTTKSRKGTYGTSHKADDADHKASEPASADSKSKFSADAIAKAMNIGVKPGPSDRHMKQAAAGFVKGVSVRQHKMQDTDESIEYYIVKEGVAYHFVFEGEDGEIIAMGRAPTANGAAMMAERMIESAFEMIGEEDDRASALEIAKQVAARK